MRKKLLAMLLVGAVAASSIIGFTACNNGDDIGGGLGLNKGEEVTEEQWKAAIAATVAAENFTALTDYKKTTSGVKTDDATVTYTRTQFTKGKYYVALDSNEFYLNATTGEEITGGEAIGQEDADVTIPVYWYYTLDGTTCWRSTYNWEDNSEPNQWEAWYSDNDTEEEAKADIANKADINTSINLSISETAGGAQLSLTDAYSLFEYGEEDGFYTASVYYRGELWDLFLSFGKGYCTGLIMENIEETTYNSFNVTVSTRYDYIFSAFGTTTFVAPEGAVAVIEAAKAQIKPKPPVNNSIVAGKTFVFESVDFEYDNSIPEYVKKQYEAEKSNIEAMQTGYTIAFDNNWGCTMPKEKVAGTYTEDGNVITFTRVSVNGEPSPAEPHPFILSGNKLTMSDTQNGVTIIMTYTLKV